MINKKSGFTMAEMVLTLLVIGVIASITMPMLNNAKPNNEMIMLKKAYYLVSRTVNELINDEDLYPESEDETKIGFSYTNIANQVGEEAKYRGTYYSGDTKFCGLFAARMNLKGTANCSATTMSNPSFTTADGMTWLIKKTKFDGANNGRSEIQVDVNGLDKGNNCFESACSNKEPDRFTIYVDKYGVITVPDKVNGKDAIEQKYLTVTNTTKRYHELKK